MKQVFRCLAALLLVLMLCMGSSMAEELDKSFCGTYYGNDIVTPERTRGFFATGWEMYLVLREDGTGYFKLVESTITWPDIQLEMPFTWTTAEKNKIELFRENDGVSLGKFYRDQETGGLTVTGANFMDYVVHAEGMDYADSFNFSVWDKFRFLRFAVDLVEFDTQTQLEDFDGSWRHVAMFSQMGINTLEDQPYGYKAMGYSMTLDTKNGTVKIVYSDGSESEGTIVGFENGILKIRRHGFTLKMQIMTNGVVVDVTHLPYADYYTRADAADVPGQ